MMSEVQNELARSEMVVENKDAVSRRGVAKLLAGAMGLGCGLGLTRDAQSGEPTVKMQYFVDGWESVTALLPSEIETALAKGSEVEILVYVERTLYRANFKIEIE